MKWTKLTFYIFIRIKLFKKLFNRTKMCLLILKKIFDHIGEETFLLQRPYFLFQFVWQGETHSNKLEEGGKWRMSAIDSKLKEISSSLLPGKHAEKSTQTSQTFSCLCHCRHSTSHLTCTSSWHSSLVSRKQVNLVNTRAIPTSAPPLSLTTNSQLISLSHQFYCVCEQINKQRQTTQVRTRLCLKHWVKTNM